MYKYVFLYIENIDKNFLKSLIKKLLLILFFFIIANLLLDYIIDVYKLYLNNACISKQDELKKVKNIIKNVEVQLDEINSLSNENLVKSIFNKKVGFNISIICCFLTFMKIIFIKNNI